MEPFFQVKLGKIKESYDLWREELPDVEVFYAVKCNPHKTILSYMNTLGIKFDCASKQEICDVLNYTKPENVIYANACKFIEHIQYAKEVNVPLLVFDSECELYKIKDHYPEAKLLLRLVVKDESSQCSFSKKFGCELNEVDGLLRLSLELGLHVIGFSFHVGSGCNKPSLYYDALSDCKTASNMAITLGIEIEIIDIGGGFNHSNFKECAHEVRRGLSLFDKKRFISEVGRFLVETSHTLYMHVMCKKIKGNTRIYYLDDGLYGSIGCKIFDHAKPIIQTNKNGKLYESILFGPTCDSFDLIDTVLLPDLMMGDILYIENFGAYTTASASDFNGYKIKKFIFDV
jgi:ornithine decarboxylase